jgi:hypothetical protein
MKIYVHDKGVILTGKVWEVQRKLKEYSEYYRLLSDWIEDTPSQPSTSIPTNSTVFLKKS